MVSPEPESQISVHFVSFLYLQEEFSLLSLTLPAAVLSRYLNTLHYSSGFLLLDTVVDKETLFRNTGG